MVIYETFFELTVNDKEFLSGVRDDVEEARTQLCEPRPVEKSSAKGRQLTVYMRLIFSLLWRK